MPSHFSKLQLPIGEGSRIPLDNAEWVTYLTHELSSLDTNFDLKLPFWGLEQKGNTYSWLLLPPFNNQVSFTKASNQLMMNSSHEFNHFNQHHSFDVLLHAGITPLSGAIRYREYLQQSGQFISLHDKIATAPEGKKMIGATHIYLWGNTLLAQEDVKNWQGLIGFLQSAAGASLWQSMDSEERNTVQQLQGGEPEGWQKQPLTEARSNQSRTDSACTSGFFPRQTVIFGGAAAAGSQGTSAGSAITGEFSCATGTVGTRLV